MISKSSLKRYLWEFFFNENIKCISPEMVLFVISCSLEMVSLGPVH